MTTALPLTGKKKMNKNRCIFINTDTNESIYDGTSDNNHGVGAAWDRVYKNWINGVTDREEILTFMYDIKSEYFDSKYKILDFTRDRRENSNNDVTYYVTFEI